METELLIIKTGSDYIRVKEGHYHRCKLDKASVFPMTKLEEVKGHLRKLNAMGEMNPALFKLILKEIPFGSDHQFAPEK